MKKQVVIALTFFLFFIIIKNNFSLSRKKSTHKRKLKKRIERILSKDVFSDAFVGIEIFNLNKNKILFEKNSHKLFTPASNLKLLTTSAALYFLPDSFTFTTDFLSNGVVVDSVLRGDLIIRGGGDPLFTYRELDSLLTLFVNSGLKKINGDIIGDIAWKDSLYFGKGWMCDDNPEPFLPYLSALMLEEGNVRIIVKPTSPFSLANIEVYPPVSSIELNNNVLTISDDTTYFTITRNWRENGNTIFADGFISQNSEPDTTFLNLYAPEKIFLDAVEKILIDKGIDFTGGKLIKRNVSYVKKLFSFERNIDTVITKANKESDNLCAEMLLRALAYEYYGKPATAKNGILMLDSLIKLSDENPDDFKIVDGSGISRYNLISPDLIIKMFVFLHKNNPKVFYKLISTLPVMGIDGTLESRHKKGKAFGVARAKTGTMSTVSSLSGLTINATGDTLLFSMMMQNFSGRLSVVRLYQDIITEILTKSK